MRERETLHSIIDASVPQEFVLELFFFLCTHNSFAIELPFHTNNSDFIAVTEFYNSV